MEVANLLPPWPNWLWSEPIKSEPAVIAIANRVLSARVNDGMGYKSAGLFIEALLGVSVPLDIWITADKAYLSSVTEKLGQKALRCEAHTSYLPSLLVVSCNPSELTSIGLPPYFLTVAGSQDRIAALPRSKNELVGCNYPSYDALLEQYELVLVPGGDHSTDLLVISTRLSAEILLSWSLSALSFLGWVVDDLGAISGPSYDRLYSRA